MSDDMTDGPGRRNGWSRIANNKLIWIFALLGFILVAGVGILLLWNPLGPRDEDLEFAFSYKSRKTRDSISAMALSSDGKCLCVASSQTIIVWRRTVANKVISAKATPQQLALSGDGRRVLSYEGGEIVLRDTDTGRTIATFGNRLKGMDLSDDGKLVVATRSIPAYLVPYGEVRIQPVLFDADTGKEVRVFPALHNNHGRYHGH